MFVPLMPTVLESHFRAGQTGVNTAAGISEREWRIGWLSADGEPDEGRGVELCADSGVQSPKSDPGVTRQAINPRAPTEVHQVLTGRSTSAASPFCQGPEKQFP